MSSIRGDEEGVLKLREEAAGLGGTRLLPALHSQDDNILPMGQGGNDNVLPVGQGHHDGTRDKQ